MTDFTRAGYRDLLNDLAHRGYSFVDFDAIGPDRTEAILRHDVDFSLDDAVTIGEIEAELGHSAWYFVLVRTPFYRIDSSESLAALKALRAQGHHVGLHFDASLYDQVPAVLNDGAAAECRILEACLDAPVDMISFHRPAKSLLGQADPIAGRMHSYQPRFFHDIGYSSDSRGLWRHGHPLSCGAVQALRAVQLLTHPIWWANDDAGDREAALARLEIRLGPGIRPAIAATVTGYDSNTGKIAAE